MSNKNIPGLAIDVSGLCFSWDGHDPLLEIDYLQIKRGERVFIEGPSGSGKSTLLSLIAGVALQELWDLIGVAEKALLAVSGLVVVVGLSGMLIALMTSLNERRREMAILRSVGARPLHVFSLIIGESAILTIAGVFIGIVLLYVLLIVGRPMISSGFGLFIAIGGLSKYELLLIGMVCLAGFLIGLIPAYRIYRYSLADGMSIRI